MCEKSSRRSAEDDCYRKVKHTVRVQQSIDEWKPKVPTPRRTMAEVKENAKLLSKVSGLTPLWGAGSKSSRAKASKKNAAERPTLRSESTLEFCWTVDSDTPANLTLETSHGKHATTRILINNSRRDFEEDDASTVFSAASSPIPQRYDSDKHKCFCCHATRSEEFHRQHIIKIGEGLKPSLCQICIQGLRDTSRLKSRKTHAKLSELSQFHWCQGCGILRSTSFHKRHPIGGKPPSSDTCASCLALAATLSGSDTETLLEHKHEEISAPKKKMESTSPKQRNKPTRSPRPYDHEPDKEFNTEDQPRNSHPELDAKSRPRFSSNPKTSPVAPSTAQAAYLYTGDPHQPSYHHYPSYPFYYTSASQYDPWQYYYGTDDINPFQPHPGYLQHRQNQFQAAQYCTTPPADTRPASQTSTRVSTTRSILRGQSITTEESSSHTVHFSDPEVSGSTTACDYDRTPIWGLGAVPPSLFDETDDAEIFNEPRCILRGADLTSNQRAAEYCASLKEVAGEDWSVDGLASGDEELGAGEEERGWQRWKLGKDT